MSEKEDDHCREPETPASCVQAGNHDIDLLIAYTENAVFKNGGFDACVAHADKTVKFINDSIMPRSGINIQFKLVDVAVARLPENGKSFDDMLGESAAGKALVIKSLNHGIKKPVPLTDHRDDVKADIVSVFVVSSAKNGVSYPMTQCNAAFAPKAYSVVNYRAASSTQLSLAHEIGHNFGCCHDEANHKGPMPLTKYAHGHGFAVNGEMVHTIMCVPRPRIPRYSNPKTTYFGQATGVAGKADNAKVMNDSAGVVAKFR